MASFAQDIRPLFRDRDIQAMKFALDLGEYADVKGNAAAIEARLADGSMPCDGSWPEERIDLFRQWVAEGCAP